MKPKRKQGTRNASGPFVSEKSLERNIKNEIAKEIKPNKPR